MFYIDTIYFLKKAIGNQKKKITVLNSELKYYNKKCLEMLDAEKARFIEVSNLHSQLSYLVDKVSDISNHIEKMSKKKSKEINKPNVNKKKLNKDFKKQARNEYGKKQTKIKPNSDDGKKKLVDSFLVKTMSLIKNFLLSMYGILEVPLALLTITSGVAGTIFMNVALQIVCIISGLLGILCDLIRLGEDLNKAYATNKISISKLQNAIESIKQSIRDIVDREYSMQLNLEETEKSRLDLIKMLDDLLSKLSEEDKKLFFRDPLMMFNADKKVDDKQEKQPTKFPSIP